MILSVICFTRAGHEKMDQLAEKLMSKLCVQTFCKGSAFKEESDGYVHESVEQWARSQFIRKNALLFIGAAGIAVRAIAPLLKNKLTDSPVLAMDDDARFVIPLLSGHVGGANELARMIAKEMEATPVITTSTDVHNKFAVDLFAKKNALKIENKKGIAKVSAKAISSEIIRMGCGKGVEIDRGLCGNIPNCVEITKTGPFDVWIGSEEEERPSASLYLVPKEYVLGIGCRRGKSAGEFEDFVCEKLTALGIRFENIACIASVDIKKDEGGLIRFAQQHGVELKTFTPQELEAVNGEFSESGFVKDTVGTGNVSERAAIAACGKEGELILHKQAENGMTLAVARRRIKLSFI